MLQNAPLAGRRLDRHQAPRRRGSPPGVVLRTPGRDSDPLKNTIRRATNAGGVTGATVGLLVILWLTFSTGLTGDLEWLRSPFHAHMTSVIGTLSIFLIGLGASQVFGRKSD